MTQANEPLILAIETATRAGSVSVAQGIKVIASRTGDAGSSHSTDLLESIDHVLKKAGVELSEVDLFAAAIGPGSFTGLRIGLATTKSLAMAMSRKCAGVSTLAAIAFQPGLSARTVALLPAGRGEVFAQMFAVDKNGVQALDEAMHLSPSEMIERYESFKEVLWAGEGAQTQIETLRREAAARNLEFAVAANAPNRNTSLWIVAPRADKVSEAVARLAAEQWRSGDLVPPENLRAHYVRPSDAEISIKK